MSQLKVNSIVPSGGLPAGASGGIIQVVSSTYTSRFASSGNGWSVITGFNATITPQSTSSKILVMVFLGVVGTSTGESYSTAFRIKRAGTVVLQGADQGNNRDQASFRYFSGVNQDHGAGAGIVGLDSPATTSSTQYTVELNPQDGITATINYEQRNNNNADSYSMDCMSSITLMEVSG